MVVGDFSRYFFVSFLKEKSKAMENLKYLFNRKQVEIGHPIVKIRSDKGREFDNMDVDLFSKSKEIKHEFSTPRTPQHNEVVEKKNIMLQKMARVMIHMHNTLMQFWVEVINTTCYTANRVFLRLRTKNIL